MRHFVSRTTLAMLAAVVLILGGVLPGALPRAQAAGASIHVNRYSAGWGDSVTVTGNGFAAGDTVVVSMPYRAGTTNKVFRTTTSADTNGNVQASFTVPNDAAQGLYTIEAKDFHGHSATGPLYVLALVYLQPGKTPFYYVIANHGFYVRGQGFNAGAAVTVTATFTLYNGNTVTVTRHGQTNGNGNLNEVFMPLPKGAQQNEKVTVTAKGDTSGKSADATLRAVYHQYIFLKDNTILPGAAVNLQGRDFVPYSKVDVSVTIPRTGASTITLSRTADANQYGNFGVAIGLPANTTPGRYTVTAKDETGGIHSTTTVTVSIHPGISVKPNAVKAGQAVTVSGGGFSATASILVSATFGTSAGQRTVSTRVKSSGSGGLTARITVPGNTNAGTVTISAHGPNGQASTRLSVQARPAPPTATPAPHSTATPVPPTATSAPAPAPTTAPTHHRGGLRFKWISIWYHVVRLGTYDHVTIQANHHKQLGIWVHIFFPSGQHYDYYEQTNHHGQWSKQFSVPTSAYSKYGNIVVITFRLWEGKHNVKEHRTFNVVG